MLAAALPRALGRLSALRYPAGLRPPRAVWRGGARGEEGSGRTGFARRRWARPVGGALGFLGAFSLFPRDAEEDGEDAIILLLKRAKMANVAFMQGQLDNAEKLYKASMSYLLSGDTKEDDNAILEMSLKLASIYAAQKQHKLALAGYEFCILTLEEKIAKQKDLPEDVLPAEEKANTRLLLGMSLDSYARYLLNINQLPAAQKMYEKALQISKDVQGETHAQTVVLMSDLATVLDAQGHHDEAYSYVKRAAELAKETQHPEEHMVLNNLAAILMHKKDFLQAKQVYKEALKQAQQKGDVASVQHIQEELAELAKRRKDSK
ncbi:tetratricopeptide repeat protein 19, mitochondrial isoform X2 [Lathamus discolor]|uniref:tetratricopeptide repeat protein 19, mitochondrial isoform X2 n=1 Tax=Lathamus discolor TaxID=678569 RepID=UPI0032B7C0A9